MPEFLGLRHFFCFCLTFFLINVIFLEVFFIINFNLVIFMNIIKFLKKILRPLLVNLHLDYLDLNVEPSVISPFSVWQKWIEQADWQKVYKCWQHADEFVDDFGYPLYQGELKRLLEGRLSQIQHPMLPDLFFAKHLNIVVVKSGSGREEILQSVSAQMTRKMSSQFVVDDAHRLIGFALSPQLVVAGVSAVEVFPSYATRIMSKSGLSFLNQKEAMLVTHQKDTLCEMMKEANVPDISQLDCFPLGADEDDFSVTVWYFEPNLQGQHLRGQEGREMRFLAKI